MNASGVNLVTTWGLLVITFVVLLAVALVWCHDVNRKLKFILARLYKGGKASEDIDLILLERNPKAGTSKTVPPLLAFFILAVAVFLLFVVPLLVLNR